LSLPWDEEQQTGALTNVVPGQAPWRWCRKADSLDRDP